MCVGAPLTPYLLASLNVCWTLTSGVVFTPGLLATQGFVQLAPIGLVQINMLVNRFMNDVLLAVNLCGAPMNALVELHLSPHPRLHVLGIGAAL